MSYTYRRKIYWPTSFSAFRPSPLRSEWFTFHWNLCPRVKFVNMQMLWECKIYFLFHETTWIVPNVRKILLMEACVHLYFRVKMSAVHSQHLVELIPQKATRAFLMLLQHVVNYVNFHVWAFSVFLRYSRLSCLHSISDRRLLCNIHVGGRLIRLMANELWGPGRVYIWNCSKVLRW